jgi:hypothetical protein
VADGGEEMTAVAEQDAEAVEEDGKVAGHGAAGVILLGIGRRSGLGRVWYVGFHVCYTNYIISKNGKVYFPRMQDGFGWRRPGVRWRRCAATGGRDTPDHDHRVKPGGRLWGLAMTTRCKL